MTRKTTRLQGALTLVTGAGSGIGRATALAFAKQGASVLAADVDEESAIRTAKDCEEVIGTASAAEDRAKAQGFACDVADAAAVQQLADQVHADHGVLDVLVNNAGVGMTGRFADMSLDDWRWIQGINLDGVVHGCHAFGREMLRQGRGHIVNLSSGLGYVPRATEPAYVTTKAAVLAFSQSLRADWRPQGVSVTAVCPGVIKTSILDDTRYLGDQADEAVRTRIRKVYRRVGRGPEAVAQAIVQAIQRDRVMVAVGWEAKLGWVGHRLLPLTGAQFIARRRV